MCYFPITIKNPKKRINDISERYITVPCAKCKKCLQKRADHWLLRLHNELKMATSAHFVTLTYENEHIIRSKNGLLTTKKSDLQDYFKRLRKREPKNRYIKYYAASEYGEKSHRPHYHIILFNVNDKTNVYRSWSKSGNYIGMVDVGDVNEASIRYVTGYIEKKVGIGKYDYDDRQPEFSLMSKNMGLYYVEKAGNHHTHTLTGYTTLGKRKYSLPRYYKNKIWQDTKTKFKTPDNIEITITVTNPIKKQISKLNYENFIKSENLRKKNFNSQLDFDKNCEALARRDNPALHEIYSTFNPYSNKFITNKQHNHVKNSQPILQPT